MIDLGPGSPKPKFSYRDPFAKGERAVWMRNNPTPAESAFKMLLETEGIKFKCHPLILGFIPDFQILEKRLLFEIDGSYHDKEEQSEYDAGKDEILRRNGWRVIRIKNDDVLKSPSVCLHTVREAMLLPRLKLHKQRTKRDRIRAIGRKSGAVH